MFSDITKDIERFVMRSASAKRIQFTPPCSKIYSKGKKEEKEVGSRLVVGPFFKQALKHQDGFKSHLFERSPNTKRKEQTTVTFGRGMRRRGGRGRAGA